MDEAAKALVELDLKADQMRREWLEHIRSHVAPWHLIPNRTKLAWRLLAGGEFFPNGMELKNARKHPRKFFRRSVSEGERVPGVVVQSPQL